MSQETLATIEGNADRVRQFIEKSALLGSGSEPYHEEIYLNIQDGQVNVLASSAGNSCISYCSFAEPYLENIEAHVEGGAQAILDVEDYLEYYGTASNGKYAELTFQGDSGSELASSVVTKSNLESTVMLPASESIKEKIPLGVVDRFKEGEKWDSDHVFFSNQGNEPTTEIIVDTQDLETVVEAAGNTAKEFFPLTVDDVEGLNSGDDEKALFLDVQEDAGGNKHKGELTKNVEGRDIENSYLHGFEEMVTSISGEVVLRTAPDAPVSVVKDEEEDGYVLRHILAPVK